LSITNSLESSIGGIFGGMEWLGLGLLIILLIILVKVNIEFKYALLITSIFALGFSRSGIFPAWIGISLAIITVTYALYLLWTIIKER